MSKRSRRRARVAREKEAIRIVPLAWGGPSAYLDAMKAMADAIPKVFELFWRGVERFNVVPIAAGTEWDAAIAEAVARGDSLPLLAYADWLEERGDGRHVEVRRVAAGMGPKPVPKLTATVNGQPFPVTGWRVNRGESERAGPGGWQTTCTGTYGPAQE